MDGHHYDLIICGAGCAGLSIADRLSHPSYDHLRILIIDMDAKESNDRTWSFWAPKGPYRYQSIYRKQWPRMSFLGPQGLRRTNEKGLYTYQTIRGIDFYDHIKNHIRQSKHITWLEATVQSINDLGDKVEIQADTQIYTCNYALDSIVKKIPIEDHLFVWQHFMGWEVEMDQNTFDPKEALLMDFRVEQPSEDTKFVYVLPFDQKRALIEVTYFSKDLYSRDHYAQAIKEYMSEYVIGDYTIVHEELDKIPMTTAPFSIGTDRVIPIGTNNATVKPSSGYAFTRIQEEADFLVDQIKHNGRPRRYAHSPKYIAYDRTLLNVLISSKRTGQEVFSKMFAHNDFDLNLKFLSEKTNIWEEMKIFSTLPIWPFTRAFFVENIWRRLF